MSLEPAPSVLCRHQLERLDLAPGIVHVFCLRLDAFPAGEFLPILSEDERARACRFRFETDRRRFVVARALLRHLLAGYVRMEPAAIRLTYGPFGKPGLPPCSGRPLHFNLSHSLDLAVYAFARDFRVGIDVEALRPLPSWESLLPLALSAREQALLAEFPAHRRPEIFLEAWTRKEAYLKGRGVGLTGSLSAFEVPLGPLTEARSITDPADRRASWRILPVTPAPGYLIGLAAERESS
jgi:4'-phosphopantetheinyl transferase